MEDGLLLVVVTFSIAAGLMVFGVSVPFAFGAALIFFVTVSEYDTGFLLRVGYSQIRSVILMAVPFFMVAGYLMERGKISEPLITVVLTLVGRFKAGLAIASSWACVVFGAISGTAVSAIAAIGTITIPRMKQAGYPIGFTASLIAASSVLTMLIPPSLNMILFAWASNTPVTAVWLATVGPGILLATLLSLITIVMMRKEPIKTLPRISLKETTKQLGKSTKHAFWALLMPVFVLGGIYGGFITPTEAAAVAVVYAIPVGLFFYRGFNFKGMLNSIKEGCVLAGVALLMFYVIIILARVLTMENIPQEIVKAMTSVSDNKYVVLLTINLFLIALGMIVNDSAAIILGAVVLMPVIREIGVNPIHFAAIMGIANALGMITPPVAPVLYLSQRVSGAEFLKMLKPIFIMIIFAYFPVMFLTNAFPEIGLWLPRTLGYIK